MVQKYLGAQATRNSLYSQLRAAACRWGRGGGRREGHKWRCRAEGCLCSFGMLPACPSCSCSARWECMHTSRPAASRLSPHLPPARPPCRTNVEPQVLADAIDATMMEFGARCCHYRSLLLQQLSVDVDEGAHGCRLRVTCSKCPGPDPRPRVPACHAAPAAPQARASSAPLARRSTVLRASSRWAGPGWPDAHLEMFPR